MYLLRPSCLSLLLLCRTRDGVNECSVSIMQQYRNKKKKASELRLWPVHVCCVRTFDFVIFPVCCFVLISPPSLSLSLSFFALRSTPGTTDPACLAHPWNFCFHHVGYTRSAYIYLVVGGHEHTKKLLLLLHAATDAGKNSLANRTKRWESARFSAAWFLCRDVSHDESSSQPKVHPCCVRHRQ